MKKEFVVTPWDVSGEVDYTELIKLFGTTVISPSIIKKFSSLHPLLKRGAYFSHRDLEIWIKHAEENKKVSILTGRGPSHKMHIGHLVPFLAAQSLQQKYKCHVYLPISEDEKFFVKPNLSYEESRKFAEDNLLDILALGFIRGKTFAIKDFSYPPLYSQASRIAKLINYSTAKAVFGLSPENNIGWSFYPAVQAAHILLPQFVEGPHLTLVPVGIDQDPFMRITRDIAEHSTLKFIKPAAIHSRFIPSLKGSAKMSSSSEESHLIYLSDDPQVVKKKINKYAFSGGKDTLEEHRKHGGNLDIDISYQYLSMLFEHDDKTLAKIGKDYISGKLLSGELKGMLIDRVNAFLAEHKKNRENIKKHVQDFMLK
jgi:tryptophanyl-tRNA synthetase